MSGKKRKREEAKSETKVKSGKSTNGKEAKTEEKDKVKEKEEEVNHNNNSSNNSNNNHNNQGDLEFETETFEFRLDSGKAHITDPCYVPPKNKNGHGQEPGVAAWNIHVKPGKWIATVYTHDGLESYVRMEHEKFKSFKAIGGPTYRCCVDSGQLGVFDVSIYPTTKHDMVKEMLFSSVETLQDHVYRLEKIISPVVEHNESKEAKRAKEKKAKKDIDWQKRYNVHVPNKPKSFRYEMSGGTEVLAEGLGFVLGGSGGDGVNVARLTVDADDEKSAAIAIEINFGNSAEISRGLVVKVATAMQQVVSNLTRAEKEALCFGNTGAVIHTLEKESDVRLRLMSDVLPDAMSMLGYIAFKGIADSAEQPGAKRLKTKSS